MRNLASIQIIKSLSPIPNADAIEKAEVLGWEIVVKKNDFKVNDKIIFCEIDSILPELPCFEFLRSKKFRIKTCKLRRQISQGIVFPISTINHIEPNYDTSKLNIDDDVTDVLKIIKYDPEVELDPIETKQIKKSWLANKYSYLKWKLFKIERVKSGNFPSCVPKTDEVRVQKMGSSLAEKEGTAIYITEKCEGTSATFVYRKSGNWLAKLLGKDGIFQVCSRNRIVFNSQTGKSAPHFLIDIAEKYNIAAKLKTLNYNVAIQGEVIGPAIQGNIYKLEEKEFKLFSIFNIDKQEYLGLNEMLSLAASMGLDTVPMVLCNTKLINDVKYYVEYSKGKSHLNPKVLREGIVVRSMNENFSFKSISPEYLLKQD